MSLAKPALACGLIAVALLLSACGVTAKPEAGTAGVDHAPGSHALVSDPRQPYLSCLRSHFSITQFLYGPKQLRAIQIGAAPAGPRVVFEPTPGRAESDQMEGEIEGAEVIGSALVFPDQANDNEMKVVEGCVAIDVKG